MLSRPVFASAWAVVFFFNAFVAQAGDDEQSWHGVEIISFTDFDDVRVKLDGKEKKAFLAGLRPLRETIREKVKLESVRTKVNAKLRANALFGRVLTKKTAAVVGLSVDAFMHHKNDFDHSWNPNKYYYCWSGWGAYNLNTYFLQAKVTTFVDRLGDREDYRGYRDLFRGVVNAIEGKGKKKNEAPAPAHDQGNMP